MTILITGCAGTLGRAFTKYLQKEHEIIGIDNSEIGLVEYKADFPNVTVKLEDFDEWKFDQDPVDLVIHCAAYKHVSLGEENVNAFIDNNIIKTRRLFAEAYKAGADILFISTDKAVEPINLYGYTKAIGEYLCKTYDGYLARSGNLLNSTGSVIPLWEKALSEGKPLPITDIRMKRFVVEADEAVRQIWEGYQAGQRLILVDCEERGIGEILDEVLEKHGLEKTELIEIGIQPGEKIQEKMRWSHE